MSETDTAAKVAKTAGTQAKHAAKNVGKAAEIVVEDVVVEPVVETVVAPIMRMTPRTKNLAIAATGVAIGILTPKVVRVTKLVIADRKQRKLQKTTLRAVEDAERKVEEVPVA